MSGIDRRRVQQAFCGQAGEYERHALVQQRVVDRLVGGLAAERLAPGAILDVGAGTGMLLERLHVAFPGSRLAGADLALGMARTAAKRWHGSGALIVCADAEHLPFRAAHFDLVVSTSTFQWLITLQQAFSEAHRVLVPGGRFRFALFGDRTLFELKDSYRQALLRIGSPQPDRTHRSFDLETVLTSLGAAGFLDCQGRVELEVEAHPDVPALLRSLKRIGAGTAAPAVGAGLGGRALMTTMMTIYQEEYGRDGLIPATYEVIYAEGTKGGG